MANLSTEPVILPWPEMQKKAERDGVDIMDYVNSMHAHVLNQRDQLARQQKRIERLLRGEFICKKCGLRKDGEKPNVDF